MTQMQNEVIAVHQAIQPLLANKWNMEALQMSESIGDLEMTATCSECGKEFFTSVLSSEEHHCPDCPKGEITDAEIDAAQLAQRAGN
jgi:hypothetical protein